MNLIATLVEVNQIGSITEAIDAANMWEYSVTVVTPNGASRPRLENPALPRSMQNGWGVMVSHRSGETEAGRSVNRNRKPQRSRPNTNVMMDFGLDGVEKRGLIYESGCDVQP